MITYSSVKEGFTNGTIRFDGLHETRLHRLYKKDPEFFFDELSTTMYSPLSYDEGDSLAWDTCEKCGKHVVYTLKDNVFTTKETVCFEAIPLEFSVNFPSGDLLIADHLKSHKDLFMDLDKRTPSLSSEFGLLQCTEIFAESNLAHFFVSNTCPTIYRTSEGVHIGLDDYDSDDDSEIPFVEGENCGMVCTDYWWTTVIDIETLKGLLIEKYGEEEASVKLSHEIKHADSHITVDPGQYTVKYTLYTEDVRPQHICSITRSE